MYNFFESLYYIRDKYYNVNQIAIMGGMNMINYLSIQFSVFGDFSYIEATSENIVKIMQNINNNDFLPRTVTNQNINLESKNIETENRISFITKDQICNFVILNERIDITFNYQNGFYKNVEFFADAEDQAFELLDLIMGKFDTKGNRVAINIKLLGNNSINDNINMYYDKCFKRPKFYIGKDIVEWNSKTNSRISMKVGGIDEILNIITNLNIVKNISCKDMKLMCHFDINTIGENMLYRFDSDMIQSFFTNTKPVITELINNFIEVDKHE